MLGAQNAYWLADLIRGKTVEPTKAHTAWVRLARHLGLPEVPTGLTPAAMIKKVRYAENVRAYQSGAAFMNMMRSKHRSLISWA